jgi:diguanylate cyclase (GGDEF)-like protein
VLWGLQAYAQRSPEVLALYVPHQLQAVQRALGWVMVWLAALGALAWLWRDRHNKISQAMAYLCVTPSMLMLVVLWVGYGLLDTPMAMVVVELLVVARALFPLRVLMPGMVLSVAMVVASHVWMAHDLMPASPLLVAPVFTGEGLQWWWKVWLAVVMNSSVWPFVVALLYLFRSFAYRRAELEQLVSTDTLTGLFNRRAFMARLALESHRHEEAGEMMSLIMIDIDHFKRINDTFGHPAGDTVLERLGVMIRAGLRQQVDVAARMGGEEFAVLLPQTTLAGAREVARKLSEALRLATFVFDGQPVTVTLSAGVVDVPGGRGEQALRVADDNLYQAKRAGRDQVVASSL